MGPRRAMLLLALGLAFPGISRGAPPAFPSELRLEAETRAYRRYELKFPSPEPGPFKAGATVWGHLYVPKSGRRPPCVLVLPIMAAPNVWIETRFVNAFLRRGFAALWLEMPTQFHRRPSPSVPSGQAFLARSAKRLGANFRQSVSDARRALDWLRGTELVDGERLGVFGVSLGAMVGAAVYSREPSVRAGAFMLGGADFADLVSSSAMTSEFVRKAGIRPEDLRREWAGLDPLESREANRGKRALLINARWDRVVPRRNGEELKRAFPDAEQLWVPLGHYSSVVHLLWAPSYVARWFSRRW